MPAFGERLQVLGEGADLVDEQVVVAVRLAVERDEQPVAADGSDPVLRRRGSNCGAGRQDFAALRGGLRFGFFKDDGDDVVSAAYALPVVSCTWPASSAGSTSSIRTTPP